MFGIAQQRDGETVTYLTPDGVQSVVQRNNRTGDHSKRTLAAPHRL